MPELNKMSGLNKTTGSANRHLLNLDSVSVKIEGVTLLDKIDLQIPVGQVTAIVGPNGAGKSTLIKAISGEQKLTSGHIEFDDQNLKSWPAQQLAQQMAVLPQRFLLTFGFTAREVVELARTPHNTGAIEDTAIVDEVLQYLDAKHLADRLYPNLSGGEQQRIQLARVLAQIWQPTDSRLETDTPKLLLLDEPSSYFDLAHQQLLVQLVRELAGKGIGIVVVLHDLNMAMSCADSIAVLCCGQLHTFGKADDVLTQKCIEDVFGVNARFIDDEANGHKHIALSYEISDASK